MEREILARAIPLALGDALTQAVVLGGWKKAGLFHETFASVLPTLPEHHIVLAENGKRPTRKRYDTKTNHQRYHIHTLPTHAQPLIRKHR